MNESINQLIDESDCRTAPASQGLLKIPQETQLFFKCKVIWKSVTLPMRSTRVQFVHRDVSLYDGLVTSQSALQQETDVWTNCKEDC